MACGFYALILGARRRFHGVGVPRSSRHGLSTALDGRVARLSTRRVVRSASSSTRWPDFHRRSAMAPAHMMYAFILEGLRRVGLSRWRSCTRCAAALRLARFNATAHSGPARRRTSPACRSPAAAPASWPASCCCMQAHRGGPARGHSWKLLMDQIPSLSAWRRRWRSWSSPCSWCRRSPIPRSSSPGSFRPKSLVAIMMLLGLGFLLFTYPLMVLFVVFSAYVMLGPVSWVLRSGRPLVRRWKPAAIEAGDSRGCSMSGILPVRRLEPAAVLPRAPTRTTRDWTCTRSRTRSSRRARAALRTGVAVAVPAGHVGLVLRPLLAGPARPQDRGGRHRRGLSRRGRGRRLESLAQALSRRGERARCS